jgi:outer membrane protein
LAGLLAAQPALADDLISIYESALISNPQLAAAEADYKAVLEQRPISRAGLLPSVDLSGTLSKQRYKNLDESRPATDSDNRIATINLNQPLFRYDRWLSLKQADSRIAEAEANFAAARQELIVTVAERYFNLLGAQDNLVFARAEQDAIARQLEQAQQRFEVGLIAITDVHEAQAAYDLAVSQEIDAVSALDEARDALRETAGQYYETVDPLREKLPLTTPTPDSAGAWIEQARQNNLRILAGQASVETALKEVRRQRSGHLPTLDLFASYGYQDSNFGGIAPVERTTGEAGVRLNVPIYAGGATSAATREAHQRFQQSTELLNQTTRNVEFETRKAFRDISSAIAQVKALSQSLVSTKSALDAEQAGFEVGTRTIVDFLDAQREFYRAKYNYALSRYRYLVDQLRLKSAAGTLDEADLNAISQHLEIAD